MTKQEILAKIQNAVFPSKEGDGVEHIDMSYAAFMSLIEQLAADEDKRPKGQATIISDETMGDQFPQHNGDL